MKYLQHDIDNNYLLSDELYIQLRETLGELLNDTVPAHLYNRLHGDLCEQLHWGLQWQIHRCNWLI